MFILFISTFIFSVSAKEIPFWKEKKEVYERIKDRKVIVSASIEEKGEKEYLKLISAGHIQAPAAFTWKEILRFENYDKISDHFRNIRHNKKENRFYMEVGAFEYYARLWIKYEQVKSKKSDYLLKWKVTKGSFKGLKGHVSLEKYKYSIAEISMKADMTATKIPIPGVLLKIGLEFIGDQMAKKMRDYIEKKYLKADFYQE